MRLYTTFSFSCGLYCLLLQEILFLSETRDGLRAFSGISAKHYDMVVIGSGAAGHHGAAQCPELVHEMANPRQTLLFRELWKRSFRLRTRVNQKRLRLPSKDGDDLYKEIRIENALQDEDGNEVALKEGAEVEVTVEADKKDTTGKR
jgi:hypothetical protein